MYFPNRHLGYHIAVLYRLHRTNTEAVVQEIGISNSQIPFLASIYLQPGISQDDISSEHFIDKGATARQIEKLEKSGLIYREVNPENRRKKKIFLTQKGQDSESSFWAILKKTNDRSLNGFSTQDSEELIRLLNKAINNQIHFYNDEENV